MEIITWMGGKFKRRVEKFNFGERGSISEVKILRQVTAMK